MVETIGLYQAVARMRKLTSIGVPFSFTFMSYNESKGSLGGVKIVDKAQLRMGYRNDQSEKANVLIGYVNKQDGHRWFYLPLLLSFNGMKIKP
jgi:hypothetical protein